MSMGFGQNSPVLKPLSITYAGTWPAAPLIGLCQPRGAQILGGSTTDYFGKWAEFLLLPPNSTITSLSFDDLEGMPVGSNFAPTTMDALTTLSAPALAYVGGYFTPNTMAALTTLSVPALTYVGVSFNPITMAALTTLSVPALTYVGGSFSPVTMAALTTLSVPALTYVGVSFNPSTMAALTTLSVPALTYVGGSFSPTTMAALTTLSVPALTYVGGSFSPTTMAALTTLSVPALTYVGGNISLTTSTGALTTFLFPSTLVTVVGTVVISSCALNQTSVDSILVQLAAMNGTNGTTAYSSKVVTIKGTSATPSVTGLAAKAVLVGRGCTVTTN